MPGADTFYTISFCTVCRNRLHHLRKTLPQNISDNIDYPNIEFIVLDYNSSDGLADFIHEEMHEHIRSGKLVYYQNKEPRYFRRSHSRNMAFKLAAGDIICNLDADNFTGNGFAFYINDAFNKHKNFFLSATRSAKDILGRICIKREDFFRVKGFDENMNSYGFEDFDLINRLELLGLQKIDIINPAFLKAITHSDKERIAEEAARHELKLVLVNYINHYSSDIIFLFDKYFERATIINNHTMHADDCLTELHSTQKAEYEFSIAQETWIKGSWWQAGGQLQLMADDSQRGITCLKQSGQIYNLEQYPQQVYYAVTDDDMISEALFFHSQINNRIKMKENLLKKNYIVNSNLFGYGEVYKNFDELHAIQL